MGPYRDPDLAQLVSALGVAQQAVVDARVLQERARLAWEESKRREAEARRRLTEAEEAYEKARWP
jgi:hypothetical protein